MNKRRRMLLVLVSLITVLAMVGVVGARTYDYTNSPLLHKAYEGYDDNIPPDVTPDFEAELSPEEYDAVSASDDSRAWYGHLFSYEFHRFEFQIDKAVSDIAQIDVLHEGFATSLAGGPGHSLFIWNYANPGWKLVASTNVGTPDQTLTGTFTANLSDYIQGGVLQLLAETNSESSCPFLYTWDGTSHQFIADINSGGGFGFPAPSQEYGLRPPHSEDYTKIDGSQLAPDNDAYRLEIAEDQNEIAYLDGVRLLAVDHSPDVEVYSPITNWWYEVPPFEIHTIKNPVSPISALDGSGRDVLPLISKVDRVCTEAHHHSFDTVTVDFGDLSGAQQIKLLYNAWVDWPGRPETAARYEYIASHPDEQAVYMPYVEVINELGEWQRVSDEEHFARPQAKPRTMVLDISDWFKTDDYRLRINNWYKTHIDYIAVDTSQDEEVSVAELAPVSADLYWKGVSVQTSPDGKEPAIPDYYDTEDINGFSLYEGKFTRYGDVLPLLDQVDDKFVIMHVGDSISINFNELEVPEGMERDYYLFSDGYYKQNFVKQFLGQDTSSVEPLPFHAMSNYPYPEGESYPDDAGHLAYLAEYNTREFRASPAGEPGHNSIYTDYVSVQITPRPSNADLKYLHSTVGLFNLTDPLDTQWHELRPIFCRDYHLSSWEDNGDGVLSYCDTINMYEKPDGEPRDYHVENVTITLFLTPHRDSLFNDPRQPMYIELEGGYNASVLINPHDTQWHEVYPNFCREYRLTDWEEGPGDGVLNFCDSVELLPKDCYSTLACPLDEDFSSWLPSGWATDDWVQWDSNYAGGTSPEALLYFDWIVGDYAYLDSSTVNTLGRSCLTLEFKSFIDDYLGGYTCRVYTRADGADGWTDVTPWSNPISDNVGPDTYSIDISSDIGPATQVRFEFDGDNYDIDAWHVDDVRICYPQATWWHVEEVAVDIIVTPEPPPVGGEAYPVSKASLLAPWIAAGVVLAVGISWYVL
ncbi:hypothetical protein ACFLVV_03455, partial [Chloroflexota bacterium]